MGAVASPTTLLSTAAVGGYDIYATGQQKKVIKKQKKAAIYATQAEAAANAKYLREMAEARSAAEMKQAVAQQAEYDRQAKSEEEKARLEAENIRNYGRRVKGSQIASLAKAGIDVTKGTALDITQETSKLTEKDVGTALWWGGEKATTLRKMGALGVETALIAGELYEKGAAGEGDLLGLRARNEAMMIDLKAKAMKDELTSFQIGTLFDIGKTLLSFGAGGFGGGTSSGYTQSSRQSLW